MAKLHMDSLANLRTIADVRRALETLPSGMEEIYDKALERIKGQSDGDRRIAEWVLRWILYARRRLTCQELQGALAVSCDDTMSNISDEDLVDKSTFVEVCAGLVVIDEKQGVIQFARECLTHHM